MRASRAPLIVLTGGPGCGKTFATKAIVQLWQSQQKDVRLAAPTGHSHASHDRPQAARLSCPHRLWHSQHIVCPAWCLRRFLPLINIFSLLTMAMCFAGHATTLLSTISAECARE